MVTLSMTHMGQGATNVWTIIVLGLVAIWGILSYINWRRRK